jgi:hypothetical protein
MNKSAIIFGWAATTLLLTLLAMWLIHPAVALGTMIGVATTTLKTIHTGD